MTKRSSVVAGGGLSMMALAAALLVTRSGSAPAAGPTRKAGVAVRQEQVAESRRAPPATVSQIMRAPIRWYPWPPREEVIGPPAGSNFGEKPEAKKTDSQTSVAEPLADSLRPVKVMPPTAENLRFVLAVSVDGEGLATARAILLDPFRHASVKLAVLERLKAFPPEEATAAVLEFLEGPADTADATAKPTAVRLLAELKHPAAAEALARVARTSSDERVRLAVAAMAAREKKQ
jgi:hypothetical protein